MLLFFFLFTLLCFGFLLFSVLLFGFAQIDDCRFRHDNTLMISEPKQQSNATTTITIETITVKTHTPTIMSQTKAASQKLEIEF